MSAAVEMPVEGLFKQQAEESRPEKSQRQGGEKWYAVPVHQRRRDIAARHREGAVSQVNEITQPPRPAEPAGQHEQHHAVGHAVEENSQHLALQGSRSAARDASATMINSISRLSPDPSRSGSLRPP